MRWIDKALTRLWQLPPPTTDYTVRRDVPVPMRDGVTLLADHYAPTTSTPAGTILLRGPYGRGGFAALQTAYVYCARGYHVVLQSVRGTFGSGGDFEPGRREVEDGADTVAWLREQPWFTGRLATMGGSYLGFTQWALLVDPPPELATAIVSVGPHDLGEVVWGSGSFLLGDFLGWSDLVVHQEDGRFKPFFMGLAGRWRVDPALAALPLGAAAKALLGDGAPWYQTWVEHPDTTADYWQPTRMTTALDDLDIPVLLITGWQDIFLDQSLRQYEALRSRDRDVALTIGPWTHGQVGTTGAGHTTRASLDWLARHLGGASHHRRSSPVQIYVTGAREWRDLPDWPPRADDTVLYLRPGQDLGSEPPQPNGKPASFVYDPADPTPTIGGRLLSVKAGRRDDRGLAERADVLSYTTVPLAEDLEVIGCPYVELAHTTDIAHADVFVRLSEVDARGVSRNVCDGFQRLNRDRPGLLRVVLDATAHRFKAGHRIRLLIAGGSHPRFARNTGTDDPPLTANRLVRSTHTIAHGSSRLVLPTT